MAKSSDHSSRDGKRGGNSPISDRQSKLAEEDARIKAEQERIQRLLSQAPKKREELVRKQREEFIKRKSTVVHVEGPVDRRFDAVAARPVRNRKMQKDRTPGQIIFVVLLITLGLALYYAFRVMGI